MEKKAFSFKVAKSRIDGKGLFANCSLPARRKIGELEGELISLTRARKLAKTIKRIAIVEVDETLALVAHPHNHFRYINHACIPNTYMRVINKRVEFYTLRKISASEELTCGYGETHHEGKLKCNCNSTFCKNYL